MSPPQEEEINIDLMGFCQEEESKKLLIGHALTTAPNCQTAEAPSSSLKTLETTLQQSKLASINQQKKDFCAAVSAAHLQGIPPIETHLKDENNHPWKIRFLFGYNRVKYFDTDVQLKTDRVDVTIKDFTFAERTSSEYYNPKNWDQFQNAFRWIDEPTNSFNFLVEHKKDVFSFMFFHPKFLKQTYQTKRVDGVVDGVEVHQTQAINTNPSMQGYSDPGAMHLTRFESTHKQVDVQLGYGHKFTLYQGRKASITYVPHIDAGVTLGANQLIYERKGAPWIYDGVEDKNTFQGMNISVGQRLEYQYGRVGVFVDQRFTHSHLKNTYQNGKAEYDLNYMPIAMGVSLDLVHIKGK
jgi:hypothetical protein